MKQDFSDRASFLKAMAVLKDATFNGPDLVYDEASHTMTLTLTRADNSSHQPGARGIFGGRRPSYLRTVVIVRRITSYKQFLAGAGEDVYVLDRAEVDRGGQELTFYFRPGDRAAMDVSQIDGVVEDAGKATSAPKKPVIANPLAKKKGGKQR